MKLKLFTLLTITAACLTSCKKIGSVQKISAAQERSIVVPIDFKYETSRTLNFEINVTDTRFKGLIYKISIYDGDPAKGGSEIAKGSATTSFAFKSKIYLSKQITSVFIVKTSPDNSKVLKVLEVGNTDVSTSIGS